VEELKSFVYTVANTCEASMEEGRACPAWININHLIPSTAGLGAQGVPQFYVRK